MTKPSDRIDQRALAVLDRMPDVPPDPGNEMPKPAKPQDYDPERFTGYRQAIRVDDLSDEEAQGSSTP